jgi:HK97 family phage major capsid protein
MPESLQEKLRKTEREFRASYGSISGPELVSTSNDAWVMVTYDDYLIVSFKEKYYRVGYTESKEDYTFDTIEDWVEVEKQESWVEKKALLMKSLEPQIPKARDGVLFYGGAVKATDLDDGSVKLGGYLITYGDLENTDLTGDYFKSATDYGPAEKSYAWFNHRQPIEIDGKKSQYTERLPDASLTPDDVGIFAEVIMKARNRYEEIIIAAAKAGKLGFSSGTAPHVIDRKQIRPGVHEITRWILGADASLTPMPAEPMNVVTPMKSMAIKSINLKSKESVMPEKIEGEVKEVIKTGPTFTEAEVKVLMADAVTEGVKAYQEAEPAPDSAGVVDGVEVVLDEADRPFKSLAENCAAVRDWQVSSGVITDPRLKRLGQKAVQGASSGVPSDAGFLLEPTLVKDLIKPLHEEGPFSKLVKKMPVGSDSASGWINGVDETSRATGSRWGGVQGYRLAQGDTITGTKPKFRRVTWELKKYAVLGYATDELLKDASQFEAVMQQSAGEEISFMANEDIFEGNGAGGPAGFMNSGCLISVTKESGQAADTVVFANLSKMWARMSARNRASAAWYINVDVEPELDNLALAVGTGALEPRYVTYGNDGVMRIKGRPVIPTEFNATLGDLGDIVLADMNEYLFWEKEGVERAASIHIQFLTDQTAFRFIYRCDGQTVRASALTPFKGSKTQSAFVALAARA